MSTAVAKKVKKEEICIELVDRRFSGFILDGTANTKHEKKLDAPSAAFIPNTGYRMGEDETLIEIRYIKNKKEIDVQIQKEKGMTPTKNKVDDIIVIRDGQRYITKDASNAGLIEYLKQSLYEESNVRKYGLNHDPLYRIIDLGKKEEEFNELTVMKADCVSYISKLYTKTGEKTYTYNEEKLNALCQLFKVYEESNGARVASLIAKSNEDPENFLKLAMQVEQTLITEITHSLELNVTTFKGNTFQYIAKDKSIVSLGQGNYSQEVKISKVADLLRQPEYAAAYQELKAEIEVAKSKL